MNEITIEEVEDILEDIGVYNHYANVMSSISCLITAIDSSFSEEKADMMIKVIKEELLKQI